jgi:hypothetical protein
VRALAAACGAVLGALGACWLLTTDGDAPGQWSVGTAWEGCRRAIVRVHAFAPEHATDFGVTYEVRLRPRNGFVFTVDRVVRCAALRNGDGARRFEAYRVNGEHRGPEPLAVDTAWEGCRRAIRRNHAFAPEHATDFGVTSEVSRWPDQLAFTVDRVVKCDALRRLDGSLGFEVSRINGEQQRDREARGA